MMQASRNFSLAFAFALAAVLAFAVSSELRADEHDDVEVCLQPTNFREDGSFELESTPAVTPLEIVDLRWAAHDGCERFVIDIALLEGADAPSPGSVEAEFIRDLGVVRVHLLDVEDVHEDAAEREIAGELASRAFVVRADDNNSLYVDLHIASEVEAAITIVEEPLGEEPAHVVIDLRPGGGEIPGPAAINDLTVLLEPRDGQRATYPLNVSGYARHFEANVVIRFERHGEEVGEETITMANDWTEAWGAFDAVIEDGPPGAVVLHIGEYSAADGSWQGVAVELQMGTRSLVPMITRDVEHE